MSLQEPQINRSKSKNDQVLPKLRKNRKLELRWGNDYYEAVNKAVFSNDESPHMPSEPPASIKEDVDKTGYVCKQCRDCFRFLSSIEEHTSRRSWVLGYWCQSCFTTKCPHVAQNEPLCSACRNVDASKHAYMAQKGVRRNIKKAVTRVFYNQCQFFAHLRMHGIIMVDLSEVMLMPLPSGIQRVDYRQFDKLCKALMETMFIRRVHIMDWLRELNIQPSRWNTLLDWMESKKKTPISDIIDHYSEDCLNRIDLAERTRMDSLARRSNGDKTLFAVDSNDSPCDEKDPLAEDDDSPNDIAFVDCGPTPSHAISTEFPEVDVSTASVNDRTPVAAADRTKPLWRSPSQHQDKNRDKIRDAEKKSSEKVVDSSLPVTPINRKPPRVVTIRTPKNVSISTIMKHLPIDSISANKILVVPDDAEAENKLSSVSDSSTIIKPSLTLKLKSKEKSSAPIVESKNNEKKNLTINSTPSKANTNERGIPALSKSQSFSEQMSLHGRIVFQNGRKYIIRHVPKSKSQSILQDSVMKKLRGPPPLIAPTSGPKIPLLPKPISFTKLTPISTIGKSKQSITTDRISGGAKVSPNIIKSSAISVTTKSKANLTSNSKSRTSKVHKNLLTKCREGFMNDLRRAPKREIETYIENLEEINERYSSAMNFKHDSVIETNTKAMACFENAAKLSTTNEKSSPDSNAQDILDKNSREWESKMKDTDKQKKCDICDKMRKPSSYIVGISIPAIDETIYCHCYNNVCYICNANQGSLVQLKNHVNWHKGEKPYVCPSCSIVFPSILELEVHIWTLCFHPMAKYVYGCGVCEIEGILDMESVAKHYLLLHTRRKVICGECKMEYRGAAPSNADNTKHFAEHHPNIVKISEPKRLLVCNLKQCIVRPEAFRTHLSDHIGVLKWIYYKCPFCDTITQGSGRNKSSMREHLVKNHLDRMHEIVSKDSLPIILNFINSTSTNPPRIPDGTGTICQVSNADPTGPKILDARTITPATFEFGTESAEEAIVNDDDPKLPKILDVRSEALEEFEFENTRANDFELEILSVKSIANDSLDSSAIESETSNRSPEEAMPAADPPETVTFRVDSLIREDIECEDSSTSHDDITVISMNSTADDSELESSSRLHESYNDNDGTDMKDFIIDNGILNNSETGQRPRRIALNSPTDVEVEPIYYNCHLCGESINTSWSVVKNHFDTRHSSDYEIFTVSPNIPRVTCDSVDESYRDDANDNNKRRKMEIVTASGSKRRRRWGPKKYFERPGSPNLGICVKPETVQEIEGSFRCKKCDQLFEDRSLLRNHIATQHRIKGQYLICLECGENFVVVPSLQMHLKALHGIQDPITYLTKNTAYAPDILDDSEEDQKLTESNQCYVCMAVFEDKPALDKHMRVHGMAFLRRKRFEAQKALKSGAKVINSTNNAPKIESNDEKSTIVHNDLNFMKKDGGNDDNNTSSIVKNERLSTSEIDKAEKIEDVKTIGTT